MLHLQLTGPVVRIVYVFIGIIEHFVVAEDHFDLRHFVVELTFVITLKYTVQYMVAGATQLLHFQLRLLYSYSFFKTCFFTGTSNNFNLIVFLDFLWTL